MRDIGGRSMSSLGNDLLWEFDADVWSKVFCENTRRQIGTRCERGLPALLWQGTILRLSLGTSTQTIRQKLTLWRSSMR